MLGMWVSGKYAPVRTYVQSNFRKILTNNCVCVCGGFYEVVAIAPEPQTGDSNV